MTIEDRVSEIENRNRRVEADKAWETSYTRRASIMLMTYVAAALTFKILMPDANWALSALIPVLGYVLSTLTLPQLRHLWERIHHVSPR